MGRLSVVNKLLNEPIPDLGTTEGKLEVGDAEPIEKLVATIRLDHTYIGDLVVTLVPPPGRGLPSVVLHNRAGGSTHNLDRQYDLSNTPRLAAFSGQRCDGTWTVRVEDQAAQDSGTLIQIGLQLSLPPPAPDRSASRPARTGEHAPATKNGWPRAPRRRATARR